MITNGSHAPYAMWETTFPRNSHAGLGKDLTTFHAYILGGMLSSLKGLPNPAWLFLGNVVSHMGRMCVCGPVMMR